MWQSDMTTHGFKHERDSNSGQVFMSHAVAFNMHQCKSAYKTHAVECDQSKIIEDTNCKLKRCQKMRNKIACNYTMNLVQRSAQASAHNATINIQRIRCIRNSFGNDGVGERRRQPEELRHTILCLFRVVLQSFDKHDRDQFAYNKTAEV